MDRFSVTFTRVAQYMWCCVHVKDEHEPHDEMKKKNCKIGEASRKGIMGNKKKLV